MPIYEFHCTNCNNTFEEWLKMSEEKDPQNCPNCGTLSQRQVSQTSFVLKGSGWYVTEYGKNSASSASHDRQQNQDKIEKSTHADASATDTSSAPANQADTNTSQPAASPSPAASASPSVTTSAATTSATAEKTAV